MKEIEEISCMDTLTTIAGAKIAKEFGEPFTSAFKAIAPENENSTAGLICSLFLSAILEGFPTGKFHTFVRFARESCRQFTFNCKSYDTIFSKMSTERLARVPLLDKKGETVYRQCCKEEIFEAFDFYTNQ